MAFLQPATMSTDPTPEAPRSGRRGFTRDDFFSQRSRKQLGLYFAGASFFALSMLITRRSMVRRYKATIPKFYQPSNRPNNNFNGAMEAFEALNIATVNVASVGMLTAGGLLWAFDISSPSELRDRMRSGLGLDDQDKEATAAEQEMEEWLATVLARKEKKDMVKKQVQQEADRQDAQQDGKR